MGPIASSNDLRQGFKLVSERNIRPKAGQITFSQDEELEVVNLKNFDQILALDVLEIFPTSCLDQICDKSTSFSTLRVWSK